MLSYIEHYQPKYFLLENVAGLLDYRFQDKRAVNAGNGAEIKLGMVKFIMRTLISLGYQVRYKTLQAAQYGVPQSRSRLIFIGAKQGLTLPEFPVPVYAFPKGCTKLSIPADEHGHMMKIPTASRWKSKIVNEDDKDLRMFHQCAPHETRTIFDATGDLVSFPITTLDDGHPDVVFLFQLAFDWYELSTPFLPTLLTHSPVHQETPPQALPEGNYDIICRQQRPYMVWLEDSLC
jgi:DNA (cytosine-5)-methyltransferase 1